MVAMNNQQKEAAEFLYGIASVVAVPGSGKTLTMTRRIGHLIKNGIAPESILGLTFTKNAALAMKKKLHPILGKDATRVNLSTIHSFCYSLLKREGVTFSILMGKEQLKLLRKTARSLKIRNIPAGMISQEINLAQNNLISIEEMKELYQQDETMLLIAQVYERYEEEKQKRLLLDFNDLLIKVLEKFEDRELLQRYQQTYNHILVDEFQDTNPAQMTLIKKLVGHINGNKSSFWICGDDWQSIYSFTGASVGNILNFGDAFPESKQFVLEVNYRSTPEILSACQNLISHNTRKIEKELRTLNHSGDEVTVLSALTEEDEAITIVNEIKDLQERSTPPSDIAILYRANNQSRVIEEELSRAKIPYHIENGVNFYQRHEVKILLDYLRLITDPDSDEGDEALRSVINVPNRYVGHKFMKELEDFAVQKGLHLYEALKKMPVKIPYLKKYMKGLINLVDPLMKDTVKIEPAELISVLRDVLNYDRYITDDDVPSPDDSKIANINQLQMAALKYDKVPRLLAYTDSFREEMSNDKNGVSLMTIHKSKGLEFPVVFVIGMIEGVLPNKNGDIEEERRIAFVGLSRAMKNLYVSYTQKYIGRNVKKSSFLEEIFKTQ